MAAPKRAGRGRPRFKVTKAMRTKVQRLAAIGMKHDSIALVIGCSDETLRKYFAPDLEHGSAIKIAEANELLWKAAKKLNASAIARLIAQQAAAEAARNPLDPPPANAVGTGVDLGKKAKAALEAQNPDTTTEMGRLMAMRAAAVGTKLN